MTNLTINMVTQVEERIKTALKIFKDGEMKQALERIKSLEEKSGELEVALGRIKSLETKSGELVKQIEELKDENKALKKSNKELKGANVEQKTPAEFWAAMANEVTVKSGISSIVTAEATNSKRKELNLIIMERKDNEEKKLANGKEVELIKSEVEKVLTAIGVDDCMEKVKVTRFNDSGPILLVCENKGTKIKILKAASKLKDNGFSGVFINNDRTVAEAANERKLREQAKERNAKLDHGTGYFKYGQSTSDGKKYKWYWGVRGVELKKIFKLQE